jgi:hypothetical protein
MQDVAFPLTSSGNAGACCKYLSPHDVFVYFHVNNATNTQTTASVWVAWVIYMNFLNNMESYPNVLSAGNDNHHDDDC